MIKRIGTVFLNGVRMPRCICACIRVVYRFCAVTAEVYRRTAAGWLVAPVVQSLAAEFGRHIGIERIPYIWGKGRLVIGDYTRISGKISILFATRPGSSPALTIGKHVFIGHNAAFMIAGSITIGDHTLIAGGVRIQDNDGHPLDAEARKRGDKVSLDNIRPVVIGKNVWVGAQSTILKGVTIGDDAVVATGSVVTRDVPANMLVAGVPARVVRRLDGDGTVDGGE